MRLITDEQHAQIVEALSDERYVSQYSHIVEALATLQALPEVEVRGWVTQAGTVTGRIACDGSKHDGELYGWIPLYATKEPK